MRFFWWFLVMIVSVVLLAACRSPLPPLHERSISSALSESEAKATRLGQGIAPRAAAHAGEAGIFPLSDAREAFAARVLLARAAERTLDVQYYIWHGDITGTLLFEALRAAADRGVRVRVLLDDNGTGGLDVELRALDLHPNIEIRLFNPFRVRAPKWIGYLTDFSRANRRMHNKSFTADNQATIVGGRNIGDEYFGATEGVLFADLDVLAVGPVVQDVSADFDRYWASASSYPVEMILPAISEEQRVAAAAAFTRMHNDPRATDYVRALLELGAVRALLQGDLQLEWAKAKMVSDDPVKGLKAAKGSALLFHQVTDILGAPATQLDLVSPYFVPTAAGVEMFSGLAKRGVKVRILTNALEATDVAAVHAGYAKWRKDLLKAGVELYEMRGQALSEPASGGHGLFGSSGSSLHAKTFSVDEARVFVGSFNFDPRSAHLNTELGFVIDSATLAQQIKRTFDELVPVHAYEVRLSETGKVVWIERRGAESIEHHTEPGTSVWQRASVTFLSWLPIEWML